MKLENLELRDATERDFDFLYQVHRETLRPYVRDAEAWDETWQLENFRKYFTPDNQRILHSSGTDIGSISVDDHGDYLFLENIALLPAYRGRGIGKMLIEETLANASQRGIPVRLNVLKVNPAWKLYRKLGFQTTREDGHRYFMEATPRPPRSSGEDE
jgi:ribosomal protein S18 acetylase RimI-like enzyme